MSETRPRRLVIGVGNPDMGDDGAGIVVAQRLALRNDCAGVVCTRCTGEATALMEAWTGFDDVVLVDACTGAGPPGSIHRLDAGNIARLAALSPRRHASTHGMGVCVAVALARALGTLPCSLLIYAIEGRHFGAGSGLSPEVDHAIDELVALLVQWCSEAAEGPRPAGET